MSMGVDFIDENIYNKFPVRLQPCLRELFTSRSEIVDVCTGNMHIHNFKCSRSTNNDDEPIFDRFSLSIPYATESLEWTILFNEDNLEFAPDFQFNDATFLNNPDLETIQNHVPSWGLWNVDNPKSLLLIIRDLYCLYKQHQVDLLQIDRNSRPCFEYLCLIGDTDMKPKNVEVLNQGDTVLFLIYLDLIFPELPIYNDESRNPNKDAALLFVKFNKPNDVESKLFLSPRIEKSLEEYNGARIPSFSSDTCLMDYVPTVKKWLSEKLDNVSKSYKKCQEYISSLLVLYGSSIIEYDAVNFTKAVLLFEVNDFYWLLTIVLSKTFPTTKPKYKYQSVNFRVYEEPYADVLGNYPYSPRWKPNIMIKKALSKIVENIESFKASATYKSTA